MNHIAQVGAPLAMVAALAGACGGSGKSRGAESAAALDSAALNASAAGPRHVSGVMIGKRIGAGNRMTDPTFQFAPQDTVYLSVALTGSTGPDKLTAAWRSQNGEVVQQSTEAVQPPGRIRRFNLPSPRGSSRERTRSSCFLAVIRRIRRCSWSRSRTWRDRMRPPAFAGAAVDSPLFARLLERRCGTDVRTREGWVNPAVCRA